MRPVGQNGFVFSNYTYPQAGGLKGRPAAMFGAVPIKVRHINKPEDYPQVIQSPSISRIKDETGRLMAAEALRNINMLIPKLQCSEIVQDRVIRNVINLSLEVLRHTTKPQFPTRLLELVLPSDTFAGKNLKDLDFSFVVFKSADGKLFKFKDARFDNTNFTFCVMDADFEGAIDDNIHIPVKLQTKDGDILEASFNSDFECFWPPDKCRSPFTDPIIEFDFDEAARDRCYAMMMSEADKLPHEKEPAGPVNSTPTWGIIPKRVPTA